MNEILIKNWNRSKQVILVGITIAFLVLLAVVYKGDEDKVKKSKNVNISYETSDIKSFKKFLLNQIKSPFTNLDYEIQKGDTIQKILKKFKVKNSEIQSTINQFKKYANPNQLLPGNKINITVEENSTTNKNSIIKFSVPITKSTTVAVIKNENNEIILDDKTIEAARKSVIRMTEIGR